LERKKLIIALLITLTIIIATLQLLPFRRLTIISVTEPIKIEPVGLDNPATEEVEGYFWILTAKVDSAEEIGFEKILESGTEATTADGKKLVAKSTISIKLEPHRPYYEMPLYYEPIKVYPTTYQASGTAWWFSKDTDVYVPANYLGVYTFARGDWVPHTPFTVYVYKNEKLIDSKYIDTVGGTATFTIENPSDPKEKITIINLGKLGEDYDIALPRLALIGSTTYVYDEAVVEQILRYDNTFQSFSCYWFGPPTKDSAYNRWKDDGSPIGLWITTGVLGDYVAGVVDAPGWEDKSTIGTYRAKPKEASFYDIISYIERHYRRQDIDIWKCGAELVDTRNGTPKLRIYMPYGAMSSFIEIRISSELADTVVCKPPVANFKIVSISSIGEVGDRVDFSVKIKQESTVRSTGRIDLKIAPEGLPAEVIPNSISPTLDPGEEEIFYFTLINLGTDEEQSGTLVVTCTELFTGSVTLTRKQAKK